MAIDYEKLNPGIRKTVKLLNDNLFKTCDSGDGETREYECDLDCAYVHMVIEPIQIVHEAKRLKELLEQHGIEFIPCNPMGEPHISADYDPCREVAFLSVFCVKDSMLKI